MMRLYGVALLLFLIAPATLAEDFELPAATIADDTGLAKAIPALATRLLAVDRRQDGDADLDDRFRLQIAAKRYAAATRTLASLRVLRSSDKLAPTYTSIVRYEIYAKAKMLESGGALSFKQAFESAFREVFHSLDDVVASQTINAFGSRLDPYGIRTSALDDDLRKALDAQHGKSTIGHVDGVALVRKYLDASSLEDMQSLSEALIVEDDRRRYSIQDDGLVKTADGASIATLVVRPRVHASTRLPTLLGFTVYANPVWSWSEARLTAAHGYVGVVAYTRGKGRSPDQPVPYEHDGADATAVIDWIAAQSWSDGRVGMYGGSYNGFAQWAAAKHLPKALKAMMPSVSVAPGIDVPMEGNVFLSFTYPWPPYVTNGKALDQDRYDDRAHWNGLNREWYVSGKAYRDLERIDGTANPIFRRWLDHPGYDAYWQSMIPYREEFAAIDIPVLTTTGYYDGGQIGALYYFTQHRRYNPHAEHYFLIGPYNHIGAQRRASDTLRGYAIDPVARIDIGKVLRYQWFDYVFRGGPRPALLKDRVNYEVMGANTWKHAPSLEAMADDRLRFYLDATREGADYRLGGQPPKAGSAIVQEVDLADRSDVDASGPGLIIDNGLDRRNALVFVSAPVRTPTEVSGLFSGQLDFIANKRDFDIALALYERLPDGRYFQLSWYLARASYIRDRTRRELLIPGKRQQLAFRNGRLTSRLLQPGSRLVIVLGIVKQPESQINYGSGKDVSDETIADAATPLRIQWRGESFVDLPIWRPPACTACNEPSTPLR